MNGPFQPLPPTGPSAATLCALDPRHSRVDQIRVTLERSLWVMYDHFARPADHHAEGSDAGDAPRSALSRAEGYVRVNGQAVQPVGARNALGRVELNPPNPHHVYLHDTPQKAHFNGGAYGTEDE